MSSNPPEHSQSDPVKSNAPIAPPQVAQTPQTIEHKVACPQCGTVNIVRQAHVGLTLSCAYCGYNFVAVQAVQVIYQTYPTAQVPSQAQPQPPTYPPPPPYMPYPQYQPYPQYPVYPAYQPYIPYYPQIPVKKRYSWELYPRFYPPLTKKRSIPATEFHAMSAILAVAAVMALLTVCIFGLTPVILNFKGNQPITGTVAEMAYSTIGTTVGTPIPDATVTIDGAFSTYTNSEGKFSFASVSSGEHKVTVHKSGYVTETIRIFAIKEISNNIKVFLSIDNVGTSYVNETDQRMFSDWNEAYSYFYGHTIILSVLFLLMLAGAYFTWKQKMFGMAVVGSGLASFIWFFFIENYLLINILLGVTSIFGIIALVLILKNRKSFTGYNN